MKAPMYILTRLTIFVLVTYRLIVPNVNAQAVNVSAPQAPQILAVGVGEFRSPPDHVVVSFAVETFGADAALVGRENAARMARLRQGLERDGVPATNMSTVGYFLRNEARFQGPRSKDVPNWFVARNGIRVTVTSLDRVGSTIDTALASGANQVDDVAFRASEERALRHKAVSLAVAHARAKAEAMATAAGGKLGSLIEVRSADGSSSYEGFNLLAGRGDAEASVTRVSRSEIVITEHVIARWQFVPNAP
jgi:uncharacterized protein